jgi:hypothetical protein
MSNKTIKINPLLFSVGGLSKKNKKKPINIPLISPNILKNKLLKRIKDHKKKETSDLDSKKLQVKSDIITSSSSNNENYTDEFNDSIEYLQSLSKQKKTNLENENKKAQIQKKTIKKYNSNTMPIVNLELPEELKESAIVINEHFDNNTNGNGSIPIIINSKPNDVPYGILKGGKKPTYRQWTQTQKNVHPNNLLSNNFLNKPVTEREQRLNLLKQKLKNQTLIEIPSIQVEQIQLEPIQLEQIQVEQIQVEPKIQLEPNLEEIILTQNLIQNPKQSNVIIAPDKITTVKKLLKKTIHRKYTLGKSNIKRTVAVLLKDQHTRKKIVDAQKDLKKKTVSDVKTYLRQHNLIKIGSNAPNDIVRKIYESAVLAGEITNNNKDTMLHNFMKDDSIN